MAFGKPCGLDDTSSLGSARDIWHKRHDFMICDEFRGGEGEKEVTELEDVCSAYDGQYVLLRKGEQPHSRAYRQPGTPISQISSSRIYSGGKKLFLLKETPYVVQEILDEPGDIPRIRIGTRQSIAKSTCAERVEAAEAGAETATQNFAATLPASKLEALEAQLEAGITTLAPEAQALEVNERKEQSSNPRTIPENQLARYIQQTRSLDSNAALFLFVDLTRSERRLKAGDSGSWAGDLTRHKGPSKKVPIFTGSQQALERFLAGLAGRRDLNGVNASFVTSDDIMRHRFGIEEEKVQVPNDTKGRINEVKASHSRLLSILSAVELTPSTKEEATHIVVIHNDSQSRDEFRASVDRCQQAQGRKGRNQAYFTNADYNDFQERPDIYALLVNLTQVRPGQTQAFASLLEGADFFYMRHEGIAGDASAHKTLEDIQLVDARGLFVTWRDKTDYNPNYRPRFERVGEGRESPKRSRQVEVPTTPAQQNHGYRYQASASHGHASAPAATVESRQAEIEVDQAAIDIITREYNGVEVTSLYEATHIVVTCADINDACEVYAFTSYNIYGELLYPDGQGRSKTLIIELTENDNQKKEDAMEIGKKLEGKKHKIQRYRAS